MFWMREYTTATCVGRLWATAGAAFRTGGSEEPLPSDARLKHHEGRREKARTVFWYGVTTQCRQLHYQNVDKEINRHEESKADSAANRYAVLYSEYLQ
jgi:hypothetical protein